MDHTDHQNGYMRPWTCSLWSSPPGLWHHFQTSSSLQETSPSFTSLPFWEMTHPTGWHFPIAHETNASVPLHPFTRAHVFFRRNKGFFAPQPNLCTPPRQVFEGETLKPSAHASLWHLQSSGPEPPPLFCQPSGRRGENDVFLSHFQAHVAFVTQPQRSDVPFRLLHPCGRALWSPEWTNSGKMTLL